MFSYILSCYSRSLSEYLYMIREYPGIIVSEKCKYSPKN